MKFNLIDINNRERKEYFEHYFSNIPCTYSMTVKLDITNIKIKNSNFYSTILFCLSKIINKHKEFRMSFNSEGKLGFYDEMLPSYTIFHKDTETFSSIWTCFFNQYHDFYEEYKKDIEKYADQKGFMTKPNIPENVFNVSMIPWTTFESFNLNLQKGYNYLLPIITLGKYYQKNDKYILPLSIQVHHAVCDGYHVCCFINDLQDLINNGF